MDDRAEHVGELGADQQETFLVGLRRCDLQQRGVLPRYAMKSTGDSPTKRHLAGESQSAGFGRPRSAATTAPSGGVKPAMGEGRSWRRPAFSTVAGVEVG
ncbi:hypothetical protein GCM10010121_070660 [Streptomyces brasiliensis]|uniref:Uncharacterized protein n=1 Tax=Streptomyces brasiliensis TaxID=1954 RepID=A0A917L8L6_9ACTN|nr:hypothetical protein GCM10010121_070660 [Streptomyces brasiliensis]